jgi:hypothetical protein
MLQKDSYDDKKQNQNESMMKRTTVRKANVCVCYLRLGQHNYLPDTARKCAETPNQAHAEPALCIHELINFRKSSVGGTRKPQKSAQLTQSGLIRLLK